MISAHDFVVAFFIGYNDWIAAHVKLAVEGGPRQEDIAAMKSALLKVPVCPPCVAATTLVVVALNPDADVLQLGADFPRGFA